MHAALADELAPNGFWLFFYMPLDMSRNVTNNHYMSNLSEEKRFVYQAFGWIKLRQAKYQVPVQSNACCPSDMVTNRQTDDLVRTRGSVCGALLRSIVLDIRRFRPPRRCPTGAIRRIMLMCRALWFLVCRRVCLKHSMTFFVNFSLEALVLAALAYRWRNMRKRTFAALPSWLRAFSARRGALTG